jgi:predicted phosphoribosyltransferase
MHFHNRAEAAHLLAEKLAQYAGQHPLILAIPRGAVPMGKIIADTLDGDLDLVLAAKIPAPGNPEFAIGTVSENGWTQVANWASEVGATPEYIAGQRQMLMEKMHRRRLQYTALKTPVSCEGRIIIVVDDGLATGMTMIGALDALKKCSPQKLVVAVPVASLQALEDVGPHADDVVCLASPRHFQSVGQHYDDFSQVSDEEVANLLKEASAARIGLKSGAVPAPDAQHQSPRGP